jgi:hypothetical protein
LETTTGRRRRIRVEELPNVNPAGGNTTSGMVRAATVRNHRSGTMPIGSTRTSRRSPSTCCR